MLSCSIVRARFLAGASQIVGTSLVGEDERRSKLIGKLASMLVSRRGSEEGERHVSDRTINGDGLYLRVGRRKGRRMAGTEAQMMRLERKEYIV